MMGTMDSNYELDRSAEDFCALARVRKIVEQQIRHDTIAAIREGRSEDEDRLRPVKDYLDASITAARAHLADELVHGNGDTND